MKKQLLTSLFVGLLATTAFGQALDESFETWLPEGWVVNPSENAWKQSEAGCSHYKGPGKAYDGEYAAQIDLSQCTNSSYNLESPVIDLSSFKNPELSFQWYYKGYSSEKSLFEVVSVSDEGEEVIATVLLNESMTDWKEYKRVLNRNANKVILRLQRNSSYNMLYIDKLVVNEGPEVAAPVNFRYEFVAEKDGQMQLTWEAINDENSWNLKIADKQIDPTKDAGVIEENGLTKPEYLAEGLTVGTHYYAYVQTVDGDKTSEWVSLDFNMDAAAILAPFTLDFDNDNGGFAYIQDGQTNQWCWGAAANGEQGGKSLYVSGDDGESFDYIADGDSRSYAYRLIQFPAEMENGAALSFDFKGVGNKPNHSMEIWLFEDLTLYPQAGNYIMPSEGKIAKVGDTYAGYEDWTNVLVEIPASYAGKTVRLVLSWRNNGYQEKGATPAAIDNLKLEAAEAIIPTNLKVTATTTNSVTLDWEQVGTAQSWEVEYGAHGFELGQGTVVKASEHPFEVTGLEECKHYDFVVRSVNGEAVSESSERVVVATKASDQTGPYFTNFDDIDDDLFPLGWQYYAMNPEKSPYVIAGNDFYTHSAPNAMCMVDPTGDNKITLISPAFTDLKDKKSRIIFYSYVHPMQTMSVGVMSDPTDPNSFVELAKYGGGESVVRHILYLNSDLITEEHKYVAFRNGETFQKPVSIDDFTYELIPELVEPANLHILDVLDTSARLTWTVQGKETKWEVAYGEDYFDFNEETVGEVVENVPMFALKDLKVGQYYTAFVRAIDADGNKSPWSEPYTFRTCDGNWEMPYMEAFDEMRAYGIAPLGWTVKDYTSKWGLSNNDYNSYPNCVERVAEIVPVNDWLFTPPFTLNEGTQYLFSFRVKSASANSEGKITVHYGKNPLPEAMGEALVTEDKLTDSYELVKVRFIPSETAVYNVGINYQESACPGLRIDDVMFQVDEQGSVEDAMAAQTPVVYPTKAQSEIFVSGGNAPMAVSVFNLNGVMVWNNAAYVAGTPISVEGMPVGTYIVQVVTAEGSYRQKVIICQ